MKIKELASEDETSSSSSDESDTQTATPHHSAFRRGAICASTATIGTALPDDDPSSSSEPNPSTPRYYYRSNSKKSLIIRIRTRTRNRPGSSVGTSAAVVVAADRLGSVVHHRIRPYIQTYVHHYDVYPLWSQPRLTTLQFRLGTDSSPPRLTLALRRKPIVLRFTVPPPLLSLLSSSRQTPLWDQRLRAFPPEVRGMILEWALRISWEGRTPDLLKALRGSRRDRDLYFDALDAFYKTNCYTLNHRNGWGFGDMSTLALRTIRTLGIDIGYMGLHFHWKKLLWSLSVADRHLVYHTLHLTDTLQHIRLTSNAFASIPTAAFVAVPPHFPTPPALAGPNPPIHPLILPQAVALAASHHRVLRDHSVFKLLNAFAVRPSSRRPNGLRRRTCLRMIILNTQLDPPQIASLIWNIGKGLRASPRLAVVPTGTEMIWFWHVQRREKIELPEDMERYENWAQTATYD